MSAPTPAASVDSRPSIGDFGLVGPLYAHQYRDPASGDLITKAAQFHRYITAAPYRRKVVNDDGRAEWRIEIPFSIWLNDRPEVGGSSEPLVLALDFTASVVLGSTNRKKANWSEIKVLLPAGMIGACIVRVRAASPAVITVM